MNESYVSKIFKIGTAGFIKEDGTFLYADENEDSYHGGFDEETVNAGYPEFSNTHPEEDTCIRAPYSYEYVKTDGNYSLYQTGKDVSLVYFYDDVISYDTYSEMDPLMRETNLMYSMVVDDPGQPENDVISDLTSVPFKIGKTENIFIDGNKFTVGEDGGYIMLDPEDIEAGQVSVFIKGLTNSTVNNWYYRNAVALIDSDNKPIVIEYSAKCPTTDKYYYGNNDILFSFDNHYIKHLTLQI